MAALCTSGAAGALCAPASLAMDTLSASSRTTACAPVPNAARQAHCTHQAPQLSLLAPLRTSTFRAQKAGTAAVGRRQLSVRATAEPAVTIDNCTVLVVGDGGVGMEVVRRLAKAGSWVTAFHEGEGYRKEIEGLGAMLAVGEATSADKIDRALRSNSFDAIVYAIGDNCPESLASRNAQLNVITSARGAKVPRFLLVSSAAGEDDLDFESVEANLREGGDLKWTIIRTGPLSSEPAGKTSLSEDSSAPLGSIAAGDLAFLISQILFDEDFEGKVLSAVTE